MTDQLSDDARAALAQRSTWVEPRAALEDLVVQAVLDASPTSVALVTPLRPTAVPQQQSQPRRRRHALLSIAAAVATVAIAAGVLVARHEEKPDFRVQLTAGRAAPDARGAADMYQTDAGFRVELDARGLPRLTGDEYYQAWLRNGDGAAVPIGTFSANGGDVTLWSGVSPEQFPAFAITIETANNHQHASGRRVLVGELTPA